MQMSNDEVVKELQNKISILEGQVAFLEQEWLAKDKKQTHDGPEDCPTYYDGCNCTVECLVHNIERAKKAEAEVARLRLELEDQKQQTWYGHMGEDA